MCHCSCEPGSKAHKEGLKSHLFPNPNR
jgi:hypothetical protein